MAKRTKSKAAAPFIARQGDVLICRVETVNGDIEPAPADPRGIVLAEGETSSHHHAVVGRLGSLGAHKLYRFRDARADRLLEIGDGGADVRVVGGGSGGIDRHTPISLEPGKYLVRVQRAWDSLMASRMVQD